MYVRILRSKNKKGEVVEYASLAESKRAPGIKHPRSVIIKNFGRVNEKSLRELRNLQQNLNQFFEKRDSE